MKTKEIYKVDGRTFQNYSQACEYIRKNGYSVTKTETIEHKGTKVHLIDVAHIPGELELKTN